MARQRQIAGSGVGVAGQTAVSEAEESIPFVSKGNKLKHAAGQLPGLAAVNHTNEQHKQQLRLKPVYPLRVLAAGLRRLRLHRANVPAA